MFFSRYFKAAIVLLALLVASSGAAPKKVSAKVRSKIGGPGDVTCQKEGKGNWDEVSVGQNIGQGSRIRTLLESQVTLNLPDGSTISIEENTLVEMSQLMSEDGSNITMASIQNGKVRFDAQKQKQGSEFKFKTGTATAAIRGTSGAVGSTPKGTIASLANGVMDLITNSGVKATITAGQTAITNGEDEINIFDLASSGDPNFVNTLENLLSDPNLPMDSITKLINQQDSTYKNELMNIAGIKCLKGTIPDTIYEPNLNFSIKCDALFRRYEVGGFIVENNDGNPRDVGINWSSTEIGAKKFPVTCVSLGIKMPCGEISTYYAGLKTTTKDSVTHVPLTLTTPAEMQVCDPGAITIEGTFDPSDPKATLTVTVDGKTSSNLVPQSAGGVFSYTMTISDKMKNWNISSADVEYNSEIYGNEKATVKIDVDKRCKAVNLVRPTVTLTQADSIKCLASVAVANVEGDQVLLTSFVDGNSIKTTYFETDDSYSMDLTSGLHQYKFEVVDLAENKSEVSGEIGCYPSTGVAIDFVGGKEERLRVPKPPGSIRNTFFRQMRFKISGIPQNDPSHIRRISISQSGKPTEIMQATDFQGAVSFDKQIELTWGKITTVKVEVVMKNGKILSSTKTYEVR